MGALSSPTVNSAETAAALAVVGELSALSGARPCLPFGESGRSPTASWAWGRVPLSALTEAGGITVSASPQESPASVSALTRGHAPARLIADARVPTPGRASATGGSTQGARRGYDRFF